MALDYESLMTRRIDAMPFSYGDRETMLYALGVGMGRDPLDEAELAYVFENRHPRTLPSMASVIARTNLLHGCGYDYTKVVHGEQRLKLYRPLPTAAEIEADSWVVEAYDKGPDRGAVIHTATEVRLRETREVLCQLGSVTFARGDGGFGGATTPAPAPHPIPERAPDRVIPVETRRDQALLYRLCGDRNPLHADPEVAKRAGFPQPILHGLCTYGTACRAILRELCGYDHTLVQEFDVRFSAPVFPGETIGVETWRDGDVVSFQCRVAERDAIVIKNGRCVLV